MGKIETATQWMIDLANDDHMAMTRNMDGGLITIALLPSSLHGKEICIRSYYNKPWTYILRYTGSTGGSTGDSTINSFQLL
jgi:hypothetical protein